MERRYTSARTFRSLWLSYRRGVCPNCSRSCMNPKKVRPITNIQFLDDTRSALIGFWHLSRFYAATRHFNPSTFRLVKIRRA